MFCGGRALPVVGVRPVAPVDGVMLVAVVCGRPVVGGGGCVVAAVLPVLVVMVVVVMGVVVAVAAVVAVVVTAAMVTAKALAQRQLCGELPDGLPLVQDGLLLPHQALAQVQDGGFGLVGHDAPSIGAAVVVRGGSVGHRRRRIAAGVGLRGDWGANKLGADPIVVFNAGQTACCRRTREEGVEHGEDQAQRRTQAGLLPPC